MAAGADSIKATNFNPKRKRGTQVVDLDFEPQRDTKDTKMSECCRKESKKNKEKKSYSWVGLEVLRFCLLCFSCGKNVFCILCLLGFFGAKLFAIEKTAVLNDKGCMPEPDEIDAQLQLIAKMLVEARAPLIYGLTRLTVEAQELAVELAMCLRGAIDTPRGKLIPSRGTSLQLHGEARTTLGELRKYADLLVFVDCELSPELGALFVPEVMASLPAKQVRYLKLSGDEKTLFDTRVHELSCRNMDEVRRLRKKLKVKQPSDLEQEELLAAWQTAKYPILVYEPTQLHKLYGNNSASFLIELLERVVLARAKYDRAAAWPLESDDRELSNTAGAEYVLTARTGFPAAVQCFNGSAEFLPGVMNAEALLADGVIDAALFLGEGPQSNWSESAIRHLKVTPTFLFAQEDDHNNWGVQHWFLACSDLKDESGTILLEDGIPIPISFGMTPRKSAEKILRRLLELVREPALAEPGAAR